MTAKADAAARGIGKLLADLVAQLITLTLVAFPVMLGLGAAHHDWSTRVPAFGFWPTLAMLAGLHFLVTHVLKSIRRYTKWPR